jgi:hypothetical protein
LTAPCTQSRYRISAYRLFFVVAAQGSNPGDKQGTVRNTQITKAGLFDQDAEVFKKVLAVFKVEYDALIKRYNDAPQVALLKGEAPDYEGFVLQRDALGQSARDRLNRELSAEGMADCMPQF